MSRLNIELSSAQHKQIKALAAIHGQTIREYVIEHLFGEESEFNDETIKALENIDKRKNLKKYTSVDDLFDKLLDEK